jgi:hypothetical protein
VLCYKSNIVKKKQKENILSSVNKHSQTFPKQTPTLPKKIVIKSVSMPPPPSPNTLPKNYYSAELKSPKPFRTSQENVTLSFLKNISKKGQQQQKNICCSFFSLLL